MTDNIFKKDNHVKDTNDIYITWMQYGWNSIAWMKMGIYIMSTWYDEKLSRA
jgi:hypothetical protein